MQQSRHAAGQARIDANEENKKGTRKTRETARKGFPFVSFRVFRGQFRKDLSRMAGAPMAGAPRVLRGASVRARQGGRDPVRQPRVRGHADLAVLQRALES
jgi:hypothetical protein